MPDRKEVPVKFVRNGDGLEFYLNPGTTSYSVKPFKEGVQELKYSLSSMLNSHFTPVWE